MKNIIDDVKYFIKCVLGLLILYNLIPLVQYFFKYCKLFGLWGF